MAVDRLRVKALDLALEEADRRFGPISDEQLARAEAELIDAAKRRRKLR